MPTAVWRARWRSGLPSGPPAGPNAPRERRRSVAKGAENGADSGSGTRIGSTDWGAGSDAAGGDGGRDHDRGESGQEPIDGGQYDPPAPALPAGTAASGGGRDHRGTCASAPRLAPRSTRADAG